MFTGLIEDLGTVESVERNGEGAKLRIASRLTAELALGDSIAVNGCCLTATTVGDGNFETEAMNQTLEVTALDSVEEGSKVNLELAMKVGDRLGGHIVQGHVDGVGTVSSVEDDGFARRVRVTLPTQLLQFVVDKGSITLSGVSLTVAELGETWAEVSLIPETLERTNLGELQAGSRLNVECDVVAKYVERLMSPFAERSRREHHG
ncbi:MAG TPA: riboflavin synthase [Solirubrobacterales bacterium]|nr:riboflavin synthase [Solirubrobacterales bacterium]